MGKKNNIVHEMVIQVVTVNFHIKNIKEKLKAQTRKEAVAKAVFYKIVEPDFKVISEPAHIYDI